MKRLSLIILILLVIPKVDPIQAQSKKAAKAFATFDAGEYYVAIDQFKDAYQKTNDKKEKLKIAYHIAECYRLTNASKQSEQWYKKVIAKNYETPLAKFYYAEALKMNLKYEEAKIQYQAYKQLVPEDSRGTDGMLSCDMALEWIEYPNGYIVEEMKFFNSKMSEYSPFHSRNDYQQVFFTSSREETTGQSEHGGTGQGFSDIFVSTMDRKGKWSTPLPLEEPINTEAEEGTPVFNSDYSTLYFTRCNISKRKALGCEIFSAQRSGEKWTKVQSLELASDSVTVAHPAITNDELTLYFVSDMDGSVKNSEGKNSKDLWRATRTSPSADWGKPENLGTQLNTEGDEVFPFVHADGTLYFSSNGHIGMGGLDIFKANTNSAGEWEIENMQYPINSSTDDFGIVFEAERESGYLSSSRKGKTNDDIYSFLLPPLKFSISGIVKDEKTDEPIDAALIKSISSDGITLESKSGKDGSFRFMLKPGIDYIFIASKKEYLKGKERETTKGLNQSTEFETEIYLSPIDKPIEIENIFFELDKAELRPESIVSLDQLVEILNDNPNITIELGSHTDARASDAYNIDLSRRRAQSVVNHLISKDIHRDRLIAKGYGESIPKIVDKKDNEAYPFLTLNTKLTEEFINNLEDEDQQEMAHFLNRRTEFKVLRIDYKEK